MNKLDIIFGLGLLVTATLMFIYIFLLAYLNGIASGNYIATIDINSIGEANLELFIIVFCSYFSISFVYKVIKKFRKEIK